MFAIGDEEWPGLSKLVEEAGEVAQVAEKLMGTRGATAHWDGSDLRARLVEELGDLRAAIEFFAAHNDLGAAVAARAERKLALFEQWHEAGQ